MSEVDRYFDKQIKSITVSGEQALSRAAYQLKDEIERQIRRNFNNPSQAFIKGLKTEAFETASYVRLSPLLSSHAQSQNITAAKNLWILLPDGAKLGFRRFSKSFNWSTIKRKYGRRLSFVPVNTGTVVLFRGRNGVFPIYKIQKSVKTVQRLKFFESADRIARENNLKVSYDGRQ